MKQIQSFNPSDMAKDIVQKFAGYQKGTEQTGIFEPGQNSQGMTDFKGLLQERQQIFGMTKEQEQTASMAASGMAAIAGLMLSQEVSAVVQTKEAGVPALTGVLSGMPESMMTVKLQNMETPKVLGEEKSDMANMSTVFLTTEETAASIQTMAVNDSNAGIQIDVKQQGADASETFFEMAENEADKLKTMPEQAETLNLQEALLKQQDILTQPAVKTTAQTVAQETVKVETPLEIPQCVAQKTVEKVSAGIQEFEIQIEPENLGKIAVKVEYGDGQATISIVCSETKTLELLKAHADDIGAVMERNLRQETVIYVDEKRAETFGQHPGDDSGSERRESEWERHREERRRRMGSGNRFLQELRLGLLE